MREIELEQWVTLSGPDSRLPAWWVDRVQIPVLDLPGFEVLEPKKMKLATCGRSAGPVMYVSILEVESPCWTLIEPP